MPRFLNKKAPQGQGRFYTEDALVRQILKSMKYIVPVTHIQSSSLREFDCSYGRADVIFYALRRDWKKSVKYGGIPARWMYALKVLPYRKQFTCDDFAQLAGVSRKRAALALLQYEHYGFCRRARTKRFWIKVVQPRPIVKRIIAVEAKLTNWNRALSQAYRYLEYANQAIVILDAAHANGAIKAVDRFKRLNVGLSVINKQGLIIPYFRPKAIPPKSTLRFWEANGEIAAKLNRKGW